MVERTVDDFNDESMSEYNHFQNGGTTSFDAARAIEGSSLHLEGGATGNEGWASTSGLDNYPDDGDIIRVRVYPSNDDGRARPFVGFFMQGESGFPSVSTEDGYWVGLNFDQGRWELGKDGSVLASTGVTASNYEDEFTEYEVDTSGSDIVATLSDAGGSQVAQISASDSTYTSGGVAWFLAYDGSGDDGWFDDALLENGVPTAPQSLSATAASGDQIDLSWSAPSNTGSGITEYRVYRAQSSGSTLGDYTQIDTVTSGTSYADTGREDGERYFYRVTAVSSDGESDPSTEADAITDLPAPSGVGISDTGSGELTVSWTLADDSSDGAVTVFRSTDGTLGSGVFSTSTLSDTNFVDTGLTADERYDYTVRRETDHASSDSSQVSAVNDIPAPTNFSIDAVSGDQFDVSWTDNSASENGYRVLVSTDGGATFTDDSGLLAADTESYTTTTLLDGRTYDSKARVDGFATSADSGTDTDTTVLPDADQPALGNGVEDEIAVDRETQVHDNGDVRWQVRETGESSWSGSATGFDEGAVAFDTLTFDITGREDGEEYEVRLRTETADATGAWTTPVSIVTKFPGATNLSASNVTQTSLDLSWTDNSDNEDGFDVERRKQVNGTFGAWTTVASLSPNTTSYTDNTVQPGRTYEYRIEAFTDDTEANSSTVQVTTTSSGVRQRRVPSQGWYVEIDTN